MLINHMGTCCDLEVDVNGEETFLVNQKVLSYFSSKFSNMFWRSKGETGHFKVILHKFPGGAEGFELILRYCYNNGEIEINPSNIFLLHCAANFMEMRKNNSRVQNLIDRTEKYVEEIPCWTWLELLSSLKQCQDLYKSITSSSLLEKYLHLFAFRLYNLLNYSSPSAYSSSEISNSQILSDTSSDSFKSYSYQATWWFEDLIYIDTNLLEKLVHAMISQGFAHATIFKFLLYYQRHNSSKKRKILEVVIDLVFLLDRSSISKKGILEIFRVVMCMKIRKLCKKKLEALVGSKMDEATIDDLLVPSSRGKKYVYNVNMFLRLLRSLSKENEIISPHASRKIASLIGLYLIEVAPDPHLRPSKFMKLITAFTNFASDTHDKICLAIDIYLQVHGSLCEEEKLKICSILNIIS